MYSNAFFSTFITICLISLFPVFAFQVWAFIKDIKEKNI